MSQDCRFVASQRNTVHEQEEYHGEGREYRPHPKCGQRLRVENTWRRVDADSVEDIIERFDFLEPCSKCFNAYRWQRLRAGGEGE